MPSPPATVDPQSPNYKWEEDGLVAASERVKDCNAIDPGVFLDTKDGKAWLVYDSHLAYIRI